MQVLELDDFMRNLTFVVKRVSMRRTWGILQVIFLTL